MGAFLARRRDRAVEEVFKEIQDGSVRVFITLDANGYNTEIWSDKPGDPLEDLVRYMIGKGMLIIDKPSRIRGPVGAVCYTMKLRG